MSTILPISYTICGNTDKTTLGTADHSVMRTHGFIRAADDWKDVEMTCYFYPDTKSPTFPSNMAMTQAARSGTHVDAANQGCNGTGYFAGMIDSGDGRVVKEYKHPTARFTPTFPTATNSLFTRYTASTTGGGGALLHVQQEIIL